MINCLYKNAKRIHLAAATLIKDGNVLELFNTNTLDQITMINHSFYSHLPTYIQYGVLYTIQPLSIGLAMATFSGNLLNSMVTIKTAVSNNNSLFRPNIIEAVVISSSPLLDNGKALAGQYQTSLQRLKQSDGKNGHAIAKQRVDPQTKEQTLEIISLQGLRPGTKIRLQLGINNSAKIINIDNGTGNNQNLGKSNGANNNMASASAQLVTDTKSYRNTKPEILLKQPQITSNSSDINPRLTPQQLIDKGLRQALPQQQSLEIIIPLLQKVISEKSMALPKSFIDNIKGLLATIPNQNQSQNPETLKRALLNSGPFLEGKLNHLINAQRQRNSQYSKLTAQQREKATNNTNYQARDAAIINADSKAKSQQLIRQIESLLGKSLTPSNSISKDLTSSSLNIATYDLDAVLKNPPNTLNAASPSSAANNKEYLDIMLQQLGRLLLATLAKTQFNQLDTLNQRSQSTNETSTNSNYWSLELPIMQGKQVDNVAVKIDQQTTSDNNKKDFKQWFVMLDFDLHKLGKMSIELIIVHKAVTATVWSELESAHSEVKKEIDSFRNGLEKVGVKLTSIDCQLGLPERSGHGFKPLVDIHT